MSSSESTSIVFRVGAVLVAVTTIVYFRSRGSRARSSKLPLPPSPKGVPILGNALDMPKDRVGQRYSEMSKEVGSDIIHLEAMGQHIIVLNSITTIEDILEKRSAVTSHRPTLRMITDPRLMHWRNNSALAQPGELWRTSRKLFHSQFAETVISSHHPEIKHSVNILLRHLLSDPMAFHDHLNHVTARTIVSITYGLDILPVNDPYVQNFEEMRAAVNKALVPGAYLVELIPALKYLPSWLPGAKFKRDAHEWRRILYRSIEIPFNAAKDKINKGLARASFVSYGLSLLADEERTIENIDEDVIADVAAMSYAAGTETTIAGLYTFVLAMSLYPEVQKKAQEELDRVLQPGSLPSFEDEPSLPYITAVLKEVLRWNPMAPFGIPHLTSEEIIYRGYRLPQGSVVIGNIWSIMHNEEIFPNPEQFNPERFLGNKDLPDPRDYIFGSGRRICPGRYIALASLWHIFASILATFEMTPLDGKMPSADFDEEAMTRRPDPFKCHIKPRSAEAVALINSASLDGIR